MSEVEAKQKMVNDGMCPDCRRGWLERIETEQSRFDDGRPIIYSIYECNYCEARVKTQFEVISKNVR